MYNGFKRLQSTRHVWWTMRRHVSGETLKGSATSLMADPDERYLDAETRIAISIHMRRTYRKTVCLCFYT